MKSYKLIFFSVLFTICGYAYPQDLSGVKIHINPGHGGWDSDDRGIATPLYPNIGPNVGFWESQSNLDKGLQLRDMLLDLNVDVQMSRVLNRTEDDLPLSTIVRMANEFQADFMLSIHSNAGAGTANYVLQLYAGKDVTDTHTYPTAIPRSDESRAISTEIAKNQIKNEMTHWTSASYTVMGDKTYGRLHMGWSDGYGVLRGLTVPGVISEGSMHDYIPENYRLMNMEYKWLEAWNFKKAFCTYFAQTEIPTGNIAGWVKDSRNLLLDGTYRKYAQDVLLPLDGATVTIEETGETYTVDNQRNGVYVFKDLQPGTYHVTAVAEGYYAKTQEVTVQANEISYFNFELNMIRNTPPQVVEYSPNVSLTDSVECSENIVLKFNWDMDEETTSAAFSIDPPVEGKITFEDSQYILRFKADENLAPGTLYTVTLDKSASHPDSLSMVEDFTFQFVTKDRSRLSLLDSYPGNGDYVYDLRPAFWLIFDRKLNTSDVRDHINVYDKEGNQLNKPNRSIKNNTVSAPYGSFYFELDSLRIDEEYKVVITPDLTDDIGVKFAEPLEITFTAASVNVTGQPVVQDFENKAYDYSAEESLGVKSASVAQYTSSYLYGKASNRFRCTFDQQDAYVIYKDINLDIKATGKNVIGLHVFGDYSRNELQLEFMGESDIRYFKLCDLDFVGWRFYEVELASLEENMEYTLTGIKVIRQESFLSESMDFYLDNMLLYNELINSKNPEINAGKTEIYPVPASDIIYVKTSADSNPLLQLYSFNGTLLKEAQGNEILVNDIAPGTYVLRIKAGNDIVSRPVMIVK